MHVRSVPHMEQVKQWVADIGGAHILGESQADHQGVWLIVQSNQSEAYMLQTLAMHGQQLKPPVVKKKLEPWKWRGITSIVGQSLQLISGFKGSKNAGDGAAIAGFAITNLVANGINIAFGKQEKDDPNQLEFLKEKTNQTYHSHLAPGQFLLDPTASRLELRPGVQQETGLSHWAYDSLKRHSVFLSESVLRTIGSLSLCFPFTPANIKSGLHTFSNSGSVAETFKVVANENPVTFKVGLMMLLGKGMIAASKEEDPYNPKPASTLDYMRQKVIFPLSSIVEGAAATWMTHDRLKNQQFTWKGKTMPDYPGALGNAIFVAGYGFRLMAPYGTRDVNIKELTAYISDSLARVSPEDIPRLLTNTAVELNKHFAGREMEQAMDVSSIYAAIARDLREYHHIDITQLAHRVPASPAVHPPLHQHSEQPGSTISNPSMTTKPLQEATALSTVGAF